MTLKIEMTEKKLGTTEELLIETQSQMREKGRRNEELVKRTLDQMKEENVKSLQELCKELETCHANIRWVYLSAY